MSGRYRLVFRGEVLQGQHKAVVKQRLGSLLKVDAARLDALFTGKAVTIRKDADAETAARFEIAFKRAGAKLRVVPLEEDIAAAPQPAPVPEPAPLNGWQLAPVGALLVEPRRAPTPRDIVAQFSLAAPGALLVEPRPVDGGAPDVSHLSIAALGADLRAPRSSEVEPVPVAVPSWEVARAGVDLMPAAPMPEPPLDLDEVDFELAPLGALLVEVDPGPSPEPPDTSHLALEALAEA